MHVTCLCMIFTFFVLFVYLLYAAVLWQMTLLDENYRKNYAKFYSLATVTVN